jgi:hypothetical protein
VFPFFAKRRFEGFVIHIQPFLRPTCLPQ